jgi:hypothetical protein
LLLRLLPANGGGTNAAETLAGCNPFADSAGNLQRIVAVRGGNPRFSAFRAAKQQRISSQQATHLRGGARALAEWTSYTGSRSVCKKSKKITIKWLRLPNSPTGNRG